MIYFVSKGGPIMGLIILTSIAGLAIILDRLSVIRRVRRFNMEKFSKKIYSLLLAGKVEEALKNCRRYPDMPLAVMFTATLGNLDLNRTAQEKMLERMGNHFVKGLERRLGGLVSIVGIAPLLGFLGTITGLIRAFMAWEKAGPDITVSALASGIYEAMLTSAAGLMVAIPYYLFYNYFISKIKYFAHELDDHSSRLLEVLTKEKLI